MKHNLLWLIYVAYILCSKCYLFTINVTVSKDIYLILVGWMPTFTQVNWFVNLYDDVPRATMSWHNMDDVTCAWVSCLSSQASN